MARRQGQIVFQCFHRNIGRNIEQIDAADQSLINGVIVRDIRHHDLDDIVEIASQTMNFDNLRNIDNTRPKPFEPIGCMMRRLDHDENRGADIHPGAIKYHDITGDISFFLQAGDAARTGGR